MSKSKKELVALKGLRFDDKTFESGFIIDIEISPERLEQLITRGYAKWQAKNSQNQSKSKSTLTPPTQQEDEQ